MNLNILDEIQKSKWIEDFQALQSLEERLDFWNTKLPVNYIQYNDGGVNDDVYNDLSPFKIEVSREDREKFSLWVIKNYHNLSKSSNKYGNLLVFELLKVSFNDKLKDEISKLELVRKELLNIKNSFEHSYHSKLSFLSSPQLLITNYTYNADWSSFEAFKDFNVLPDYKKEPPYVPSILKVENGFRLAQYWKYLEALEVELNKQGQIKEYTLDQKLLVMYYFNWLPDIQKLGNATKQGVFLERFIGEDAERARQRFSSINELIGTLPDREKAKRKKLKEDLEVIIESFKELGHKNIVKTIQAHIEKLSQ